MYICKQKLRALYNWLLKKIEGSASPGLYTVPPLFRGEGLSFNNHVQLQGWEKSHLIVDAVSKHFCPEHYRISR